MYRDITTYNQRDAERKPSILENNVNGISFRVHKRIYCGDQWLLTCRELGVEEDRSKQPRTKNIILSDK